MRDFLEVFKYTFRENIRKKSFIISTVIIIVIIVAAMVIPAVITNMKASDNSTGNNKTSGGSQPKNIIYLLDKSGYFSSKLDLLQQQFMEYDVKTLTDDKVESVKAEIKEKGGKYLIVTDIQNDVPKVDYYTQQYMEGPDSDKVSKVLNKLYSAQLLMKANVPEDTISKALTEMKVNVNTLGKSKIGGYISSIFIVIILFFAVYFYGYGVSMSVASEKTSRVMEILVTSVKPSRIILGKTAGMGLLGLLQLGIILIVGAATYSFAFPDNFTIDGMHLDFSGFTPGSMIMIVIYFILGYTLYALMNAVVGATVSKAEDIQSAMMPMSFIAIIAFYFSYGTFAIPDSTIASAASLIPLTAPFSVPSRLIATEVPIWEIALSLAILIGTIILVGMVSIKLYSFAVLHYGDRLKLGKLFEMSKSEKNKAGV